MKCSSTKIEIDRSDDGRCVVKLVVGNIPRSVGKYFAVNKVAWVEMPPGMARSLAAELIEAAALVERSTKGSE